MSDDENVKTDAENVTTVGASPVAPAPDSLGAGVPTAVHTEIGE